MANRGAGAEAAAPEACVDVAEGTGLVGSVGRVEALSDGVVAIIITIMVLELKVPEGEDPAALWHLWPTFLAYGLSFGYVAIYWVNHHRLLAHATRPSAGLVWANMALLFALSLVPFATAYLGEHHFGAFATRLYLVAMLLPAIAYVLLQGVIARTGHSSPQARTYHRATRRKGIASSAIYALGFVAVGVSPWLGVGCAVVVAVLHALPWSPLDRLFLGRA